MRLRPDDIDRQVIPRWRDVAAAGWLGELDPLDGTVQPVLRPDLIAAKRADWSALRRLGVASDLLASTIGASRSDEVIDAAHFVVGHDLASSGLKRLAERILNDHNEQLALPISTDAESADGTGPKRINWLRRRLRQNPRNVLLWVEISRQYAIIGQRERAVHAMEIALGMAKDDRFVVRSAARLFVHARDAARALEVIRSASSLRKDTWLMAAEIAVAAVAGRGSTVAKKGLRLVQNAGLPAFHLAELASALGTLEASAGATRNAKRLIVRSVEAPTENAVAQAQFMAYRHRLIEFDADWLETSGAYEARAAGALATSQFSDALAEGSEWLHDQPFSREPSIFMSYVASIAMGDDLLALGVVNAALKANPDDWLLLNNRAYSLASLGKLPEAIATFSKIRVKDSDPTQLAILKATGGLLQFRVGLDASGREMYLDGLRVFESRGEKRSAALAAILLTREELLADTDQIDAALSRAREYAAKVTEPEVNAALKRIEALRAEPPVQPALSDNGSTA